MKILSFYTLFIFCVFSTKVLSIEIFISPLENNSLPDLIIAKSKYVRFKSPTDAMKFIETYKNNNSNIEPINVYISGGRYFLDETLTFKQSIPSEEGHKITWKGMDNKSVVFSAGKLLNNCIREENSLWSCDVSDLGLSKLPSIDNQRVKGSIPGFDVYVNNKRLNLARTPNENWFHINKPFNSRKFSFFAKTDPNSLTTTNNDIHIWPGNDWYDQYIGVTEIDSDNKTITLSSDTAYPLSSGRRFSLVNNAEYLDSPWEWYYDKSKENILFLLPEGLEPKDIIISLLDNVIRIDASANIQLSNIHLQHSRLSGFQITNSSNIDIHNVEISNVGKNGIFIQRSQQVNISEVNVHHTGTGGIYMDGGSRIDLNRSDNMIINTKIHSTGHILAAFSPAISLYGVGGTIRHCLIYNTPGVGILVHGNEHLIEKTEIKDVCKYTSDCGAIYSGRDWSFRGNTLQFNYIHELHGEQLKYVDRVNKHVEYDKGGVRGVYLDDGVSGFTVFGNILNNAGEMSIQIGGGRDNIIQNNIINTNKYAIYIDNRWPNYNWNINRKRLASSPYLSPTWIEKYPTLNVPMINDTWPENNKITNNIIISTNNYNSSLRYYIPSEGSVINKNIIWNDNKNIKVDYDYLDLSISKSGANWKEWTNSGIEDNSFFIDPRLTIKDGKVLFKDSIILKTINFKQIPNNIGLSNYEQ
ncbi:MAG: right-handed parallel beta-helix repeat-containing protein [Candidatus Thiodiazotropha taylori]